MGQKTEEMLEALELLRKEGKISIQDYAAEKRKILGAEVEVARINGSISKEDYFAEKKEILEAVHAEAQEAFKQ